MGSVESSLDSSDEDSSESRLNRSDEDSSGFQCQTDRLVKENHQEILDLKMKANSSGDSVVHSSILILRGITTREDKEMQNRGHGMMNIEEKNNIDLEKKVRELEIEVRGMDSKVVEMEADIACLNEELSIIRGRKSRTQVEQQQQDHKSTSNLDRERLDQYRIDFEELDMLNHVRRRNRKHDEPRSFNYPLENVYKNSHSSNREVASFNKKRVTIHLIDQISSTSSGQHGKLIILPDSIEELLKISEEKFAGSKLTRVVNTEEAQIDDVSVIRDGDHLFFHCSNGENLQPLCYLTKVKT